MLWIQRSWLWFGSRVQCLATTVLRTRSALPTPMVATKHFFMPGMQVSMGCCVIPIFDDGHQSPISPTVPAQPLNSWPPQLSQDSYQILFSVPISRRVCHNLSAEDRNWKTDRFVSLNASTKGMDFNTIMGLVGVFLFFVWMLSAVHSAGQQRSSSGFSVR